MTTNIETRKHTHYSHEIQAAVFVYQLAKEYALDGHLSCSQKLVVTPPGTSISTSLKVFTRKFLRRDTSGKPYIHII